MGHDVRKPVADALLIKRFQSGESAAFDELFVRYRRLVYSVVDRIVDDAPLAEDLTQMVFVKLLKAPSAYRDGSFAAWLARVSRNCALDELRKRKRFIDLPHIATDDFTPFERVAADLDACRVQAAVRGLIATQRSVIELSFFEGLTHAQIAEKICVPIGTVKTRIRTGLLCLRNALNDRDAVHAA